MQVMSNGRVRRSDVEWRELLSRYDQSGLSAREFCRKEAVQVTSLLRWQQKLTGPSARDEFVSVVTTPTTTPSVSPWTAEVILPNGITLRIQG